MITRIAPTPSGFLHQGNALNFLLVDLMRKKLQGKLLLRLDDFDRQRYRQEYAEDVFRALDKLQIEWDLGPATFEEFLTRYSQQKLYSRYWEFLNQNIPSELIYTCICSRSELGDKTHQCSCRIKNLAYEEGKGAIRVKGDQLINGQILWRRENIPSYHLVSIFHDFNDGITHVVRGEDLKESTLIQAQLATLMGLNSFSQIKFFHHALLVDDTGQKLSKSVLGQKGIRGHKDWDISYLRSIALTMLEKLI